MIYYTVAAVAVVVALGFLINEIQSLVRRKRHRHTDVRLVPCDSKEFEKLVKCPQNNFNAHSIGYEYCLVSIETDITPYFDQIYRYTHGLVSRIRYFRQTVKSKQTSVCVHPIFKDTMIIVIPTQDKEFTMTVQSEKNTQNIKGKMVIIPLGQSCSVSAEKFLEVTIKFINSMSHLI